MRPEGVFLAAGTANLECHGIAITRTTASSLPSCGLFSLARAGFARLVAGALDKGLSGLTRGVSCVSWSLMSPN